MSTPTLPDNVPAPLDRARAKAFRRLLPLLFVCYVIAYVDRSNVAIAKLQMTKELPGFDNAVIGFGAGVFFLGYFLLEIPGTLIVEKWSARKWICRIMVSWGFLAALTAAVHTPIQFYVVRFLLGLAEAGFFPGVIVYLTHWFPSRDRARALAWFFIGTPVAQMISPFVSLAILRIGTDEVVNGVTVHHPELWGLEGWQWVYIFWGIPAVILGIWVLFGLTDRPHQATWLTTEEREALELELKREKSLHTRHMTVFEALSNPKVLILAATYFFVVTGNYGVEFFLPSILEKWYLLNKQVAFGFLGIPINALQLALLLPPLASLVGQMLVGWSSDRTRERRLHTCIPIYLGALGLVGTILDRHPLWLTLILFSVVAFGLKAYLPAFWSLPSLFLTEAAAAGSIGLINSVGNLGGFVGPYALGYLENKTGSYMPGIVFLSVSMAISATIILVLGLGRRAVAKPESPAEENPLADSVVDPV